MKGNFNEYAQYYNLLYKEKKYRDEATYVSELIQSNQQSQVNDILDLGCGTGNHDYFLNQMGYSIEGVDLSSKMINEAKQRYSDIKNIKFHTGNINNWQHPESKLFDVVISLFHVMSYQTTNIQVIDTLKTACNHLKPNGLFIFDCWFGPGVLNDKPSVRIKRLENEKIKIIRISEPNHRINENIVDINFDINILSKETNQVTSFSEVHSMRYFFIPEIFLFSEITKFQVNSYYDWMKFVGPKEKCWNAVFVLKKPN